VSMKKPTPPLQKTLEEEAREHLSRLGIDDWSATALRSKKQIVYECLVAAVKKFRRPVLLKELVEEMKSFNMTATRISAQLRHLREDNRVIALKVGWVPKVDA